MVIKRATIIKVLSLLASVAVLRLACAEDWPAVSPEELQMTREPKAPGAPAIYLYRQVDRDDNGPSETVYARIKILTVEGLKYANVEIPFVYRNDHIGNVRGRTIRPDGSIVNFDGTVYQKTIVSSRRGKVLAATFTMPAVEVGSIIEYRYRDEMASGLVSDSRWILSQDLFTRYAKFSLLPSRLYSLQYSWPTGLPPGTAAPAKDGPRLRLETRDVPAFVREEFMPPEDEMKYRVDFLYSADNSIIEDPAKFWKEYDRRIYRTVYNFVDQRRAMTKALEQIVLPGDAPETELRKIYARTQQIRNVTFEPAKSELELKHDDQKDAEDVGEVWKRGYGEQFQINWLFLALVRAAGLQAAPVAIPARDRYFFFPALRNIAQLNCSAVVVTLDGKELFFDPGTPNTPYGLLPWYETAVTALRLDWDGGGWVKTPLAKFGESRIERKAVLKLDRSGSLAGKLTVTYTGLEAQWRRLNERNEDQTARREFLEEQVKDDVPAGIDITLTNQPDWNSSDLALVAEFDLGIQGWITSAGQHVLLPVGLFARTAAHTFEHAVREHPLYFEFPNQTEDDITIELPAAWPVSSVPKARNIDLGGVAYSLTAASVGGSVHLARTLRMNLLSVPVSNYPQLRDFFQSVRSGDEQQVVLSPGAAPVGN